MNYLYAWENDFKKTQNQTKPEPTNQTKKTSQEWEW